MNLEPGLSSMAAHFSDYRLLLMTSLWVHDATPKELNSVLLRFLGVSFGISRAIWGDSGLYGKSLSVSSGHKRTHLGRLFPQKIDGDRISAKNAVVYISTDHVATSRSPRGSPQIFTASGSCQPFSESTWRFVGPFVEVLPKGAMLSLSAVAAPVESWRERGFFQS